VDATITTAPEMLPTSNIFLYCDDLTKTYEELRSRGVEFLHPPAGSLSVEGRCSRISRGNRFALAPRE
jgi:hypothetical protein